MTPQFSEVAKHKRVSIETAERLTDVSTAIHSTDFQNMYCTIKDIKGAFNPKLDSSNQGVIIEARDSLLLTADRPWILEVQGTCDVNAAQFYFLTGHCQIGKHAEWKTNNAPGDSTQHAMTNMLWLVESHGRSHCSCISCHFSTNTVNQPN